MLGKTLFSPILLAFVVTFSLFAQAADTDLPLMPWPSQVTRGSGQLKIDANFTAGMSGAGSTDPRAKDAVRRALYRLFRETGIPVSRELASENIAPTLLTLVQRSKPGIQKYGDDESYHLTVTTQNVRLDLSLSA
ncbi:MAG TPA: hypothetical protein VKV15_11470 [Bryobacteraceae bacterium]|nr:hypothetical protein [Bryobacteraceae bacterium]